MPGSRRASKEVAEMADYSELSQREKDEGLWDACEVGDKKKAEAYRTAGADPNWVNPQKPPGRAYQFTALHIATDKGHLDIVEWLAGKGGADLNKKSVYGETALQHAGGRKGLEKIEALLKAKTAMLAVMAAQKFAAQQKKAAEKMAAKREAEAAKKAAAAEPVPAA